ncbi:MAG: tetratricopeptide repeat protein, partial [Candidatus Schekmanbacteria bacterium]
MKRLKLRIYLLFFVLALILIFSYRDSFKVPFQYDDLRRIAFNPEISYLDPLKIFTIYPARAITQISYSTNLSLWGFSPFGFHLVNLFFHFLNGILFYLLIAKLTDGDSRLSLLSSAIFLLHPVNVESVTYISGRAGVLSNFFLLLGLIFFMRMIGDENLISKNTILPLIFFLLASFSKESGFAFPFFLLLFFIFYEKNKIGKLKKYSPYFLLWLFLILSYLFINPNILSGKEEHNLTTHFLSHIDASLKYLRLLLFPINLNIDHYLPLKRIPDLESLITLIIILGFIILAFRNKNPSEVKFFSGWYIVSFIPVIAVPLNDVLSERWLYTASMAYSFLFASFIIYLMNIFKERKDMVRFFFLETLIVFIIVFFSIDLQKRNFIWLDSLSLWQDAAKKSPLKARPLINLGTALLENYELDKAAQCFKKVIQIKSDSVEAYLNLGLINILKRDYGNAYRLFKKAESINPKDANVHMNLGNFFRDTGDFQKAVAEYKKAIALDDTLNDAYGNLGIVYSRIGKMREAEEELKKAAMLDVFREKWKCRLALFYIENGMIGKAENLVEKLASKFPQKAKVHNLLGIFYGKKGDLMRAQEEFSKAFLLSPSNINYLVNKALTLKKMGKFEESLNCFFLAERHQPNMPDILYNIGEIFY